MKNRTSPYTGSFHSEGFSLVELLAVIALVVLLLVLAVPAVNSLGGSSNRSSAVSQVMQTLERARMLALSSGRSALVAFAGAQAPKDYQYRAYAVFLKSAETGEFLQESAWKILPRGVSFRVSEELSNGEDGSVKNLLAATNTTTRVLRFPNNQSYPAVYLQYDPTGMVAQPLQHRLHLGVFNGHIDDGMEIITGGQDPASSTFMISIARYTGRSHVANR